MPISQWYIAPLLLRQKYLKNFIYIPFGRYLCRTWQQIRIIMQLLFGMATLYIMVRIGSVMKRNAAMRRNAVRRTARAAASAPRRPAIRSLLIYAVPAGCCPKPFHAHASAQSAAEAISDEGRPRRRSVENRRPFDCFKSAVRHPIQRSRKVDPEIVSPRRFLTALRLFSSFAPRQFMQA